jgi:glycerol-3-phosphate acyltransferase PlsY
MPTAYAITAVLGYLLGALPFGYLVARSHGVNIFEVGSKNPGATNVRRVLGRGPGNLVFALDALKGAVATFAPWGYYLLRQGQIDRSGYEYLQITGLIAAFLGHSFSCFTRFRGGKGVATGAGGFAVLFPVGALIALGVWILGAIVTRFVSAASMLAAASLPVVAAALHRGPVLIVASTLVAVLVIVRHRTNLARIRAGTESRIGQKKAAVSTPSTVPTQKTS